MLQDTPKGNPWDIFCTLYGEPVIFTLYGNEDELGLCLLLFKRLKIFSNTVLPTGAGLMGRKGIEAADWVKVDHRGSNCSSLRQFFKASTVSCSDFLSVLVPVCLMSSWGHHFLSGRGHLLTFPTSVILSWQKHLSMKRRKSLPLRMFAAKLCLPLHYIMKIWLHLDLQLYL